MRTADDCEVLVVGAGLAGLVCAGELAAAGLDVLLCDARPDVARGIRTTGIFVRRTLEDFALPADCLGPVIRRVTLYSPARRPLQLVSEQDEFRIGRMGRLYERMLAACLRAGARFSPATRLVGGGGARGGVHATLRDRRGDRSVRARYVVGADGVGSTVARLYGLDVNTESIVGVEDVLAGAPPGPPELHCFLDARLAPGYLAWLAHDGEESHVGVGGYLDRFHPARALAELRAEVDRRFGLAGASAVERRAGRIPVGGLLRRTVSARALLAGDASGAVSPLTAGGLDPCMRQARAAARAVEDWLWRGDRRGLDAYGSPSVRTRFLVRRALRRVFAAGADTRWLEWGWAALRLPGLHQAARHVFFGRGSFPDVLPAAPLAGVLTGDQKV